MKKGFSLLISTLLLLLLFSCNNENTRAVVTIEGDNFLINGKPTYADRVWQGHSVEGLLMNSRMVQGIFDDENPETAKRWVYPDDSLWSVERNTAEFVAAMDEWASYGLNSFTLNLQGGSPMGYGNKNWNNTAFDVEGNLKLAYVTRLTSILDKANELEMVVILGYFYFGQDQFLKDEEAVINATRNATLWLLENGYRNVIVELNNECDIKAYDHDILKEDRIHELISLVKGVEVAGQRLLVGTSYSGGFVPLSNVVEVSDFLLIHGNAVEAPEGITAMIEQTKAVEGYSGIPIVINEDDHYAFDQEDNNFIRSLKAHVSWGFFDFRRDGESFEDGFQSVPVDWRVSSPRKKDFFKKVKEIVLD